MLGHLHFGAPLATGTDYRHLVRRAFVAQQNQVLDPVGTEVPTNGRGDLRAPGLAVPTTRMAVPSSTSSTASTVCCPASQPCRACRGDLRGGRRGG